MLMLLIYFFFIAVTSYKKALYAHYYQYHVKIIQGLYLVLHRENYIHFGLCHGEIWSLRYKDEDIHLQDIQKIE